MLSNKIYREELFKNIKYATLDLPSHLSDDARDLLTRLLDKDPKKRLGARYGSFEIKQHPFFSKIDWDKMMTKQYIPPEPYIKQRFKNFLKLPADQKTNQEVYKDFIKDLSSTKQFNSKDNVHINGWSFALTQQ